MRRVKWSVGRKEENPQVKTQGVELLTVGSNHVNRLKGHHSGRW